MAGKNRTKEAVIVEGPITSRTARNRRRRQKRKEAAAKAVATSRNEALSMAGAGFKPRSEGLGKLIQARVQDEWGVASTHDGSVWLAKALDPCHPEGAVLGVPDAVSCNVVSPQYTTVDSVGVPVNLPEGLNDDWSFIELVDFSTGTIHNVSYIGDIATAAGADLVFTSTILPGAQEVFTAQGYSSSRVTYAGVTYDFSGPTVEDQGRQVCVQLTPEWKQYTTTNEAKKKFTWLMSGPSGSTLPEKRLAFANFMKNLAESDPKSYADAAKNGAYFPIRNNNPFRFKKHDYSIDSTVDNPSLSYINPFLMSIQPVVPLPDGLLTALGEPWDMNASIYWVTGLSRRTTYQRTIRYGFEITIEPDSPFRPYAHVSPGYDRKAIESLTDIGVTLSSAYPASFNFLGKLWDGIKNLFKKGKKAFDVVKPFLPIVAPIVGLGDSMSSLSLNRPRGEFGIGGRNGQPYF